MVNSTERPIGMKIDSGISLYYQNCRGICSKQSNVFPALLATEYDLIVFVETWLTDKHGTGEYFPDIFDTIRCDRPIRKRGGGVSISIRKGICVYEIVELENNGNLEYVCLKMRNGRNSIYLYALYVAPIANDIEYRREVYNEHVRNIECIQRNEHDLLVMVGDFNLPNVKWGMGEDMDMGLSYLIPYDFPNDLSVDVLTSLLSEGLCQLNALENKSGNILDLFFVSDSSGVKFSEEKNAISVPVDEFHTTFGVQMSLLCDQAESSVRSSQSYDFKNAPFECISDYLFSIDFEHMLRGLDVNESVNVFYDIMKTVCDNNIDRIDIVSNRKMYPWENDYLLKNLKNRKRKLKKKMNICPVLYEESFKSICVEYETRYKLVYNNYVSRIQSQVLKDPKKFWQLVDSKRADRSIPDKMLYDNSVATSNEDCAGLFAVFFNSVYRPTGYSHDEILNFINECDIDMSYQAFDDNEVLNVLLGLDTRKGRGPDFLPPIIYKSCAYALARPIRMLIEKSINSGYFPDELKISYVTPIFKSGKKNDIRNYRSVSVVSTLARIFEKVVLNRYSNVLCSGLYHSQHGFMKNRSTVTNLLETTSFIADSLQSCAQVDIVYLDFEKAFDSVNHFLLLKKVARKGLCKRMIFWLFSFIDRRKNFVRIKDAFSQEYSPTSGVPAGCSISSIIFNIFIDDITKCSVNGTLFELFADDVKVLCEIKSETDCTILQSAINSIEKWSGENLLPMNIKKIKSLSISRSRSRILNTYFYGDIRIENVDKQRDLGVIFDSRFDFSMHMESLTSNAFMTLGFVKRFAKSYSIDCRKTLYCSLVRSKLEYASQIWSPYHLKYKNMVERVQRNFTSWALNLRRDPITFRYVPYELRLETLQMEELSRRRAISAAVLMYDIISNRIDAIVLSDLIVFNEPTRNLRHCKLLRINNYRATYLKMQPMQRMMTFFNKLTDIYLISENKNQFKRMIKSVDADIIMQY